MWQHHQRRAAPGGGRGRLVVAVLAAGLAALAGGTSAASAQTVVGRVLEEGSGVPVAGAMVRLVVGEEPVGRGWLTAQDGRFQVMAPGPGTYALLVERIGFETVRREGVHLEPGATELHDVVVSTRAVELGGLRVETEGGRCRLDEQGDALQRYWDEARKALNAASWTAHQAPLRFVVETWERQIAARTSQVLSESREQRETVGANSVQSLPPEELAEHGYVQRRPGYVLWFAPDADVLLSDAFQRTHCFSLEEREEDGVSLVGLAFEPHRDRDLPDVKGVIWLERETARLDRVEFRYTDVDVPLANRARGEVRFTELADGRWIVRDWFIQAPVTGGGVTVASSLRRGGGQVIHEVGNRVEVVEGPDFMWQPDLPLGSVRGMVYDSITGQALAGAVVRVAGRPLRTRADLGGNFRLDGLTEGVHRLTFRHPLLDSLGVEPGSYQVQVRGGEETVVTLAVPRWETLLARTCNPEGRGALVGVVRSRQGRPVSGATVELEGRRTDDGKPVTDVSDMLGGYVFCNVPAGVTRVRAMRGRASSDPVEVRTVEDGWAQADLLLLPAPRVDETTVPSALLQPALVGTVLAQDTREPLPDVRVQLLDDVGDPVRETLTDAEGRFRILLSEPVPAAYLRLERLGYTGAVSEALDLSHGTHRVEVLLHAEAIELDPVMVVVRGRVPKLEAVGFYGRATSNPGLFIRRDDIEAVAPARTSDLLERAPGVRVWRDYTAGGFRRRIVFTRLTLSNGERCFPSVYVDGEMTRIGGSREETEAPAIEGIDVMKGEDVPSIDELVPPAEIEAVEMYMTPGQVPRQFTGLGTRCGVIVIWTRERR